MDLPLPKINFDDINKFEASWGAFLLVGVVASFIFKDKCKIIPIWIKIIVVVIASIATIRGLCKWRKRQTLLDENLDLDNKEKKQKLQDASQQKIDYKETTIAKEVIEQTTIKQNAINENLQPEAENKEMNESAIDNYRKVIHKMFQQLSNISNPDYMALKNKSINNFFLYDLIYQSQKKGVNDKVVEVRYIKELQDNINIMRLLNGLDIQISMYRRDINQATDIIMVIVYKNSDGVSTEQFRNKIKQHITDIAALHGMQLYFVQEEEIDKFNANILLV